MLAKPRAGESIRERRIRLLRELGDKAWGPGQYVGQENFMTVDEILQLARITGIREQSTVLDLCCGTAGPGLLIAKETGCRITGVDRALGALQIARRRARDVIPRPAPLYVVADACHLPFSSTFDAILLLETMLSIREKKRLLAEVQRVLSPGGRFGLTLEEGEPLADDEQQRLPEGDQVWLVTGHAFHALLSEFGFRAVHVEDHTETHACVANRIAAILERDRAHLDRCFGVDLVAEMLTAHETWASWLSTGRVRKLAIVVTHQ